ncbi:MAG: hypothetical protein GYA21_05210 [Myxococcales bacterium]|nr:hypothetical protein [Myxococcales bacterium]
MKTEFSKGCWVLSAALCGWLSIGPGGCSRDFEAPPVPGEVQGSVALSGSPTLPAAGARVRLLECGLSALADSQGLFHLNGVPTGDYSVRVDGVSDTGTPLAVQLSSPARVRGPAVTDLGAITLGAAGRVRGQATLADGGSPLYAVVYAVGGDRVALVADDGSFRLEGLPAGRVVLGASRPGYQLSTVTVGATPSADRSVEVPAGSEIVVELSLVKLAEQAAGNVRGMVVLGNPGARAGLRVELEDRFLRRVFNTQTASDGRFEFAGVPIGVYHLRASHDGYRPVGIPNLEVRADETLDLGTTLVLTPETSPAPSYPWDDQPGGSLDDDGDGVPNDRDNCPMIPNTHQMDSNGDGVGDVCQAGMSGDPDGDGVFNENDNCPAVFNPDQANHDDDPLGDACDTDLDNDGIPNDNDDCPLIPDPFQEPTLCQWPAALLYAAQDPETGDIRIHAARMTKSGLVTIPITRDAGEAWSPAWDPIHQHIYFQHRPRATTADPHPLFRICRVSVKNLEAAPECFAWGDEVGSPAICGTDAEPVLFYEKYRTGQGFWDIYSVPVKNLPGGGNEAGLRLALAGQLPAERPGSLRFPSCRLGDAVSQDPIRLGFATDFAPNPQMMPADPALQWTGWEGTYPPLGGRWSLQPLTLQMSPSCHARRSAIIPVFIDAGSYPWIFDCQTEASSNLLATLLLSGASMTSTIIQNGAANQHPAYLPIGTPEALPQTGLLAYQSDRSGSVDLFLSAVRVRPGSMPITLTVLGTLRLSDGPGFEGTPAWAESMTVP